MDAVRSVRVLVEHDKRLLTTVIIDGKVLENVIAARYEFDETRNVLTLKIEADSTVEFTAQ
jgi:hypothetical protein